MILHCGIPSRYPSQSLLLLFRILLMPMTRRTLPAWKSRCKKLTPIWSQLILKLPTTLVLRYTQPHYHPQIMVPTMPGMPKLCHIQPLNLPRMHQINLPWRPTLPLKHEKTFNLPYSFIFPFTLSRLSFLYYRICPLSLGCGDRTLIFNLCLF